MRIAIIADWLDTFGGAEHVIAELLQLYPDAIIFTTVAKPSKLGPLQRADIRPTYLQRIHNIIHRHQLLLPLMPRAIEDIDLTGFDLIISSSHAVAKGIVPPSRALHVCYCHTPMRYAWEMEDQYLDDFRVPHFLRKTIKKQLIKLRRWDMTTAKRVDVFIANSSTTQERIQRIYNRTSVVIPPPVDDRFFNSTHYPLPTTHYFLAVGRLVPYKRFDLLIELANAMKLPLKIAGRGQDEARLKKLAGPTVEFLGFVPDEDLPALYGNAMALFFPQEEDAGIVPLEAQACGTPVIAYGVGGALDSVKENETGIFFKQQTIESLRDALERFQKQTWNRDAIRNHAQQFSQQRFQEKIKKEIGKAWGAFKSGKYTRDAKN